MYIDHSLFPELFKDAKLGDFQDKPLLFEFANNWLKKPVSLYIYGKFGVGKTHLVYALIKELRRRYPHECPLLYSSPYLDSLLLEAIKSDQSDIYLIKKVCEAEILIIDDLGREMHSERLLRQFFEIIDFRYAHRKLTIMTSNSTPEDLQGIFDGAILSRLQNFTFLEITGSDRRKTPNLI